jgi:diguanylate cyclase (GGDEF)-like protein
MLALGEALGVLHLREEAADGEARGALLDESRRRLAVTVAERLAMALANLNLRETLRYQSIRDPLTGLFNRRYFEASLDREIRRVKRRGVSLGILLLDLDHFKLFNDAFGHEAGDVLLKAVGELLRRRVRGDDVACRYGGEEFALILPEAPLEVTRNRAEELRRGIKEMQVLYEDEPLGSVSLSIGVAVFPEHGLSGEDLVRAADAALYQSKAAGRDRVTVAPLAAIDRRLMLPD